MIGVASRTSRAASRWSAWTSRRRWSSPVRAYSSTPHGGPRFEKAGFRILVALTAADGTRAVSSFAPGYGWYDPKEWKRSEVLTTKLRVTVPKTFPEGEASVSFALLDESSGKALGIVTRGLDRTPG